jgi:hypothetical protein
LLAIGQKYLDTPIVLHAKEAVWTFVQPIAMKNDERFIVHFYILKKA